MKRLLLLPVALAFVIYVSGCAQNTDAVPPSGDLQSAISHFDVSIEGDYPSSEQTRAAFDEDVVINFSIQAIGKDGKEDNSYSGKLRVRPTSGIISNASGFDSNDDDAAYLTISGGKAEDLTLTIKWGIGNGRIVVEEMVPDFFNPYQRKTMDIPGVAVGLSEPIYFCAPSVKNIQQIMANTYDENLYKKALNGKSVLISYGKLVVTGYTRDGFFATDVSDPDTAWASIYVYTWRSPYVDIGSKLRYFSGQVSDFYGFTEISSFPDWQVVGNDESLVPAPHLLSREDFNTGSGSDDNSNVNLNIEPYESGLVRVESVYVLPKTSWDMNNYYKYGQWPVSFDPSATKADFVVITRDNLPNFDPYSKCAGKQLDFVQGNLREHVAAGYMIIPRMESDIDINCH